MNSAILIPVRTEDLAHALIGLDESGIVALVTAIIGRRQGDLFVVLSGLQSAAIEPLARVDVDRIIDEIQHAADQDAGDAGDFGGEE